MNDAPTPQNTPSSAAGSYMQKQTTPTIPSTISENPELIKSMISNNPLLLSAIEEKLSTLIGTNSGYFHNLNKNIKKNVYAVKGLQFQQFKIEAEFQADLMELEIKYLQKFNKIYDLRKQYVAGDVEQVDEDLVKLGKDAIDEEDEDKDEENEDQDEDEEDEDEGDTNGVPFFWLTAMQNLPPVADMITDRDLEVLKHLTNIKLEYMNDGNAGFKLIFEFSENEFFSNTSITKYYYYQKELGYNGEFIYDFAKGDEINWFNNNVNVTLEIEIRKQRNKHTKQIRTIEKSTPTYSFFNFFTPPRLDDVDNDEDEVDVELEENLQNDYSIGELIKEKLIPRAVDWFTGNALKYEAEFADEYDGQEEDDDDENDEDDEDEDEDDDEDDDDEDEDEDDGKEKPECKQQ